MKQGIKWWHEREWVGRSKRSVTGTVFSTSPQSNTSCMDCKKVLLSDFQ